MTFPDASVIISRRKAVLQLNLLGESPYDDLFLQPLSAYRMLFVTVGYFQFRVANIWAGLTLKFSTAYINRCREIHSLDVEKNSVRRET